MNTQGEGSVVVRFPPPSKRLLMEQASRLYSHEACPRSRCRSLAADAAACGPARSARAGAPAPALMRRGHPVPLPLRSCAAPGHCGMLAPVGPLRSGFRPPALAPLRVAAAVGPPSLRGFAPAPLAPSAAASLAAWLGLSAPALARRSGGSRPPSASLRPALRRVPARAACARPVGCARPWAAPGSRCASPCAPLRAPAALLGRLGLGLGPPSAAPLGLRCACPRGSRRGASGGAAPRSSRPPAPRRRGVWIRRLRAAWGCSRSHAPVGAAAYKAASLCSAPASPVGIHASRCALASPHPPHSLSARAYSAVTSGRSCSSAAWTFARSW